MIETPADAPQDQASADTPKVDGGVTWKDSVSQFYQQSTGGGGDPTSKKAALSFIAQRAVRLREEAKDKLEEQEAEREAGEADERKRRREEAGEDGEGDEDDEEEDEENYGTRGTKLRPVGVDSNKDWGDTGTIWDSEKPEYPRNPGCEACARYAKTGRCKFIDEGMRCNFDHPPPDEEQLKEREFLRKKGLRVVKGTWGHFTRRGKAVSRYDIAGIWVAFFSRCQRYRCGQVPGKSIDVTNALSAMLVEQGGLQLELPTEGKAHLPGFGDPCPGLKKQLRIEIILSGGGSYVTKK
eukprot:COSAG04_NODE_2488_length_4006_cov_2.283822_3_plen_296_part_00